jgi:hypothetical protein
LDIDADELTLVIDHEGDRQLLVVVGWLHDLGYSPTFATLAATRSTTRATSRRRAARTGKCALVAHHSAATFKAEERGLLDDLEIWSLEESAVAAALWMADITTGPRGEKLPYDEWLSEG